MQGKRAELRGNRVVEVRMQSSGSQQSLSHARAHTHSMWHGVVTPPRMTHATTCHMTQQLVSQLAAAAGPAIAWVGIGQVPPLLLTPP
jgi:hypothetical protein